MEAIHSSKFISLSADLMHLQEWSGCHNNYLDMYSWEIKKREKKVSLASENFLFKRVWGKKVKGAADSPVFTQRGQAPQSSSVWSRFSEELRKCAHICEMRKKLNESLTNSQREQEKKKMLMQLLLITFWKSMCLREREISTSSWNP